MPLTPPPRVRTFDYIGLHRYLLTICALERAAVFVDADDVAPIALELLRTADAERFSVIAYCFMPDHMHALVEGTAPSADFRKFVRRFKQLSSFHWKETNGRPLWQRRYFEHMLRNDEDSFGVAGYILENPVRAGLVRRPEDYPLLGSFAMTVRELLYRFHQPR